MSVINSGIDIRQDGNCYLKLLLFSKSASCSMLFSKSFGYAIRGVLYIAASPNTRKVRIEELAYRLQVPRHFMGKVMKTLVKNGILNSSKGPSGGFYINSQTFEIPLIRILEITDGLKQFDTCVLRFEKCNQHNPCPLHNSMSQQNSCLTELFTSTTIGELVKKGAPIKSLI
jgi:Rrf2 family protein